MTGYGRASCEFEGRRLVVELRSVNHRYLEVKLRLPWSDPALEAKITGLVRAKVERGVVSLAVRDEGGGLAQTVRADVELARSYARAFDKLRAELGLGEPVSLELLAAQPGVLALGQEVEDTERLWQALLPALHQALAGLIDSRTREGRALADDLQARARALKLLAAELVGLTKSTPDVYRRRLEERLERALAPGEVDPARLAQEVAILAERVDVAEELTRLQAHLSELERLLANETAVAGRRLDFVTQELNREVNTIGAKSQSAPVTSKVVDAKAEIERMREQIQNVE